MADLAITLTYVRKEIQFLLNYAQEADNKRSICAGRGTHKAGQNEEIKQHFFDLKDIVSKQHGI